MRFLWVSLSTYNLLSDLVFSVSARIPSIWNVRRSTTLYFMSEIYNGEFDDPDYFIEYKHPSSWY